MSRTGRAAMVVPAMTMFYNVGNIELSADAT